MNLVQETIGIDVAISVNVFARALLKSAPCWKMLRREHRDSIVIFMGSSVLEANKFHFKGLYSIALVHILPIALCSRCSCTKLNKTMQ